MKRVLVFAGNSYYADGGWEEFLGDFDTTEEATAFIEAKLPELEHEARGNGPVWWQIVDTEIKSIIAKNYGD